MNAIQCDYCGKFAPNPGARREAFGTRVLPADWYGVAAWPGGSHDIRDAPVGEQGEFCSRACIAAHFDKPLAS